MTDSSSKKLISEMNFCVFDLETTGGNHKTDKIIEIGLVKIRGLKVIAEKNLLINPEIKIPDFIQKLTSISQKDVKDKLTIEEVIDEILEFMENDVLVAHNTSFDIPFFNSVLSRLGRAPLQNPSICTNLMTKYLIPNLMNSNLKYMSYIFKIKHKKAHRALDDAKATAQLLLKYLEIFINKDIRKINHLYYPRNKYELDRANYTNDTPLSEVITKIKNIQIPMLITVKGDNGVILFSIPIENVEEELDFIHSELKNLDWKNITLKLYGPFIEAFIHFSNHFNKMTPEIRERVVDFFWQVHLKEKRPKHFNNETIDKTLFEEILKIDHTVGEFMIMNHLVPDQYIIYPVCSITQKSELVFRFPDHKKKLIQYIKSKSNRMANNRIKKTQMPIDLKNFIHYYILKKSRKTNDIFFFGGADVHNNMKGFFNELDHFLSKNPNSYQYPSKYI
ncbi:MAG: 3'-5' exonuclease [Halobacteriovoraceae bacterium]|nr:3'-5' exonuclease [Halobacteriovoraceae bacterium]